MEAYEYPVLLRTIVGSHAHGLATERSDRDYREVFYVPTRELLTLPTSARPKSQWASTPQRMVDDEAGWELGHFLEMALAGNPNVVELFWAPADGEVDPEGEALRELAPAVLATDPIRRAFLGYAENARRKILTDPPERTTKWTSTYLRVLYTAREFFLTGEVHYPLTGYWWGDRLRTAREGKLSPGDAVEEGVQVEERVKTMESVVRPTPDLAAVNEWLLRFRREHWDG